jgi:hypothetical protein
MKIRGHLSFQNIVSIVSIIIGLCGILLFFYKVKPEISFDIINESNLIDINKPQESIKVIYKGRDIEESNQNIRLFVVRVQNTGQVDITQNHFDSEDPWGLIIKNAEIIDVKLLETNSSYLEKKFKDLKYSDSSIIFPNVIFDSGNYFTIEVKALHERGATPEVLPRGKILGINKISVRNLWASKSGQSFFSILFEGNLFLHAVRVLIYIISLNIIYNLLKISVKCLIHVVQWFSKVVRHKKTKKFKEILKFEDTSALDYITFLYEKYGRKRLEHIQQILSSKEMFAEEMIRTKLYNDYQNHIESSKKLESEVSKMSFKDRVNDLMNRELSFSLSYSGILYRPIVIELLKDKGFLSLDGENNPSVNPEFLDTMKKLLNFLH